MATRREIKEAVLNFIQGFCDTRNIPIPFPVVRLADHKNFSVQVFNPKDDLDLTEKDVCGGVDYDSKTIYVSGLDSPARQRFTIAHELGHVALHGKQKGSVIDYRKDVFTDIVDDDGSKVNKEFEANTFAAELLMPERIFRKIYLEEDGLTNPMATVFNVSPIAINYRKNKLNNLD